MGHMLWVIGIVCLVSGCVALIAGLAFIHSIGSVEELEKDAYSVLDQYEDEEIVSDNDMDRLNGYIIKPLRKASLACSLIAVGTILPVIGGILVTVSRRY